MILWTIQPPEIYNLIQEKGYYACEASKSSLLADDYFKDAYDWLNSKMTEKIDEAPKGPIQSGHGIHGTGIERNQICEAPMLKEEPSLSAWKLKFLIIN